ncbi:MAG: dehydrogenase [Chloroflexi bacterium]|nr:dehydrogenase [Chloroflexota bacterium]
MAVDGLTVYRWMALSRDLEAALCRENPRWFPAEGEEASIVGAFCDLRADDAAAPHYRGPFVVYLMRGAELWRLAGQALGKAVGYSKGRSVPFNGPVELGLVPWVAGDLGTTVGVATGAALAFWYEQSDRVCVCSFGDGTANRGDFHESLNLAACWKLPVVYVCQNNGWSISEPSERYLPAPIAGRAAGYGIPGVAVDGNDVDAVRAAVGEAVARARRGAGPTLVEARTWRVRGHWAGDEQGYRRGHPEGPAPPDPLALFGARLVAKGEATTDQLRAIALQAAAEVAEAVERARAAPDAGPAELGLDEVYAGGQPPAEPSVVPREHSSPGRRISYMDAVVEAIAEEMRGDARVLVMGQDVGPFGGPLQGAKGLYGEFGPRRVLETPISESALVGAAIGAALFGQRPIVEISFGEFLPCAMSQLVLQAPNLHYMTGGVARVPVVIRTRVGDGPYGGHPQDYSAWFAHVPGLKVVMPAEPQDAKGLMAAAIRDDGPVLFIEPMALVHGARGEVPDGEHVAPIGPVRLARAGRDITVVALGAMVPPTLQAAATLAAEGVDVEVIDLRTLAPWDRDAVLASVRRTGRVVIAHEAWATGGFGAEIAATVAEHALETLAAPIARVGALPVPVPSGHLRRLALPNAERIVAAVRAVLAAARPGRGITS